MNFAVSGVIRALGYRGYPARREHVGTRGLPLDRWRPRYGPCMPLFAMRVRNDAK